VGSEQTIKLQQLPFWKLNSPFLFFSFMKFVKTDFLEDGHPQFVVIFYNVCLESTSYCYWKTIWRFLSLLLGLLLQVRKIQQLIRPWACWSEEAQVSSATALDFALETMILESITCSIFEQMVWFSHLKALIFVKLFSNNHWPPLAGHHMHNKKNTPILSPHLWFLIWVHTT
jgi:hypothetical protein